MNEWKFGGKKRWFRSFGPALWHCDVYSFIWSGLTWNISWGSRVPLLLLLLRPLRLLSHPQSIKEVAEPIQQLCAWEAHVLCQVWLWDPTDCSPPGSSVRGILQARILEWVAILFSRGSSQPWDRIYISYVSGRFFAIWATREDHSIKLLDIQHKTHYSVRACTSSVLPGRIKTIK